jgi:GH24 family phage-related lysozyme (muramidase)
MSVNKNIPSFEEYYHLEEGVKESILAVWDKIRELVKFLNELKEFNNKEEVLANTRKTAKAQSKWNQFIDLLKNIYQTSPKAFDFLINTFNRKARKFMGELSPFQRVLTVTIPHLFVLYSIHMAVANKDKRHAAMERSYGYDTQQMVKEIKAAVEEQTPPSPEIQKKTEEVTKRLVDQVNLGEWNEYTNPNYFTRIIQEFEAGDYTNFKSPKAPMPLKAYADRTQVSIGYGTKVQGKEHAGSQISKPEALARLHKEIRFNRSQVDRILKSKRWNLNNIQKNGLTDFAFNRGYGELERTIKKANDLNDVAEEMLRTTFFQGKPNPTLKARRNFEVACLLSGTN